MVRMRNVCWLIALLCLGLMMTYRWQTSSAQTSQDRFTIAQVLSAPFPSDLIAAPTGERLAWVFNAEGKRNLWVAEGPEFKARQLTKYDEDDGQELTNLGFTRDGAWLVYVRGGDENAAGETPNPTSHPDGALQAIFAVSFDKGSVVPIALGNDPVVSTVDNKVVYNRDGKLWLNTIGADPKKAVPLLNARGNLGSPQWSPDGKQLAFVSNRGDHSFICLYDLAAEKLSYLAPTIDRDSFPRWSPDGKRLAFVRQPTRGTQQRGRGEDVPDPWAIWVAEVATLQAKEVWHSGTTLNDSLPRWAGDDVIQWAANGRIVFRSEMDGWMRLYTISMNGETAKPITPSGCEAEQIVLSPDKLTLFCASNCNNVNSRHIGEVKFPGVFDAGSPNKEGDIEWSPTMTGDGKYLAYFTSNAQHPGTLQIETRFTEPERVQHISFLSSQFPKDQLVTPSPVTFKAADGLEIHGQLFLPKDAKPGEKLPAVVFSHGGPMRQMLLGWHSMYYYHNTYAFNQFLASKGYAVLSVNYRAGIGYGRAFREAPKRGGRGAAEYQDIVAGAHYLRSRTDIDTGRIGLWGGSYGGFLTAMGLARNSDLFAAGVDIHGVHDWASRLTGGGGGGGGEDRDAIKIARESSPLYSVEKWRAPVLLIHGDDDRNVAFSQTTELARRLREQKVEFEQLVFPDEIHDFLLHRHWVQIFDTAFDFLERHLGTRASTPASREGQSNRISRNAPAGGAVLASVDSNAFVAETRTPEAVRTQAADILIRNGRILDGSGSPERIADLAITGERITFIGDAKAANITAKQTIDATGLIVAPGFIDPHTHADGDLSNARGKANLNYLMQGVTTVVVGNDGSSPRSISKALQAWETNGIGTNALWLAGHGSIRGAVLGAKDVAPTPEQLDQMRALMRQAMEDGAFGMSTGLYYAPGSFSKTEEVIELAKVVAAYNGIYDTHMRDESSYTIGLLGSIEETIRIGREARLPVHISHIKALGVDVWGQSAQVIALIEKARQAGINVTANQYPYTASGTSLTASLVPRWAEAGGNAALLKRIDDPALRPRLMNEMEDNMRRRGGANSLLITSAKERALIGKRLDEIAKRAGKPPIEAALDIIKQGGASVASFNMNERDIEALMRQPWVMTGSDGSGGHPRKFGTYPRKLSDYVLKRGIISLPRFIQASSAQVAETLGLPARGTLRVGYFADVIVFNEKEYKEQATYEAPEILATGMRYVIVNGKLAVAAGHPVNLLAGRALRKNKTDK